MPNNSGEFKDLFVNHKKRRTIIVILLIILIILILLLISRCSYDLAHGHAGVTGEFIGIETLDGDPSDSTTETTLSGDVSEDPSDDTTEPIGGGSDPSDTTVDDTSSSDPDETIEPEEPGDTPNEDVDTSISLRPFKAGGKVEFESEEMVPGRGKDISVVIDSNFYQSRDLYFKLKVTKDKTNWVNAKLADVLIITITCDNGVETFTRTGTFSELDGEEFKLCKLHSQTDVKCDINVQMDTSAGNEYINSILEADFIWRADN